MHYSLDIQKKFLIFLFRVMVGFSKGHHSNARHPDADDILTKPKEPLVICFNSF